MYAICEGYKGLLDNEIVEMAWGDVSGILAQVRELLFIDDDLVVATSCLKLEPGTHHALRPDCRAWTVMDAGWYGDRYGAMR